jgi:hypothetical protein
MNKLTIWVDPEWEQHPQIVALAEQGHLIQSLSGVLLEGQIMLSKRAWNWSEHMWPYLEIALKQARKENRIAKSDSRPGTAKPARKNSGKPRKARRGRKQAILRDTANTETVISG